MKNKKSKKFLLIRGSILLIVGLISLFCVIYFNFIKNDTNPFKDSNKISDALKFKQEYESLNNIIDSDGENQYVNINIDEDNPVVYKSSKEIVEILDNGTGIIYLGFSKCPWCRNAIPVLIDAAEESELDELYYLDIYDMRNELVLEDGKIITKKEGTTDYLKMVELLNDFLSPYDGLEDESIKRIYAPTVVFVKDGNILGIHEGTVESHTNAKESLNETQYSELKNIYLDGISKVYENAVCTDGNSC